MTGPSSSVTGAITRPGNGSEVFQRRFTPSGAFRYVVTNGLWLCATANGVQRSAHRKNDASPWPRPSVDVLGASIQPRKTSSASNRNTRNTSAEVALGNRPGRGLLPTWLSGTKRWELSSTRGCVWKTGVLLGRHSWTAAAVYWGVPLCRYCQSCAVRYRA